MKLIVMIIVASGLLLGGCEKKSETAPQKAEDVQHEATSSVVDQSKSVANEVAQQVSDVVSAKEQKLQQTAVEAEQVVQQVVDTTKKELAAVAKEKVVDLVEKGPSQGDADVVATVVEQVAPLEKVQGTVAETVQEVSSGDDALSQVVAVASETISTAVEPAAVIVIKNSKGDVTLPHAVHGSNYGCVICHGEGTPGPFELGRSRAHKLCKDCHKEKNGPVKCSGCHVK